MLKGKHIVATNRLMSNPCLRTTEWGMVLEVACCPTIKGKASSINVAVCIDDKEIPLAGSCLKALEPGV